MPQRLIIVPTIYINDKESGPSGVGKFKLDMAHDDVAVQDAMIQRVNNFKRIDELRDTARHNAEKQQETQRHSQNLRSIIDEQRLTKGTLVFLKEERATHKALYITMW